MGNKFLLTFDNLPTVEEMLTTCEKNMSTLALSHGSDRKWIINTMWEKHHPNRTEK